MPQTLKSHLCLLLAASLVWSIAASASEQSKSQKVIDFEDEVVEGLNKRPLDSLSQISERNKKRHKPHLYRKRVGFRTEVADTLHSVKQTP